MVSSRGQVNFAACDGLHLDPRTVVVLIYFRLFVSGNLKLVFVSLRLVLYCRWKWSILAVDEMLCWW